MTGTPAAGWRVGRGKESEFDTEKEADRGRFRGDGEGSHPLSAHARTWGKRKKLVCVSCIDVPILFSGFEKRLWHQA